MTATCVSTEDLVGAYLEYLRVERRLVPLSIRNNEAVVRRFVERPDGFDPDGLDAEMVHAFVLGEARRLSVGSTRGVVSALRGFLRFLFATGACPRDLSGCVPGVAGSRLAGLPKAVDVGVVRALLDSCDRSTPLGRRDFAVLVLLSRLGLRAAEVAGMQLGDIDWRAGEMTVRGKGGRLARMPVPADVGDALVDYLRFGRPVSTVRAVFLSARRGPAPMSRNAVVFVSRRASRRAGIGIVGSHRLRHTAGTEMLRHGAALREVSQVLRHRDDLTTSIYAKVDRVALDLVVRPWPEPAR